MFRWCYETMGSLRAFVFSRSAREERKALSEGMGTKEEVDSDNNSKERADETHY
ncbi:unnamed protein product, partial [Musa textilis]